MKSKIILLLLTFALVTNIYAELKNNKTTLKVELTNVLQINQTKEIKAKFTDLADEARAIGIKNIYLTGKISYKKNGNYSNLDIIWSGLENNSGLSKINQVVLSESFYSKLTTDDQQILPPQNISVKVDKDILMQAVNALNEKNRFKAPAIKLDKKTIAALKTKDGNSSGVGNANQQELPQLNKVAEEKDETVNITEVACPIRYSIDDLKAYEQKSINTVDSNGNTLSVGACLDSGVSYKLSKTYGAPCTPLVSANKVYQSYRITGVVAGDDKIIRDCQIDLVENTIPVQTTTDQCNYEHHLDLNLSYQTERKFYKLNDEIVNISQCESNKKVYQHKEVVCSYDLEVSPGFAVPQTKLYITLDDGTESIVRGCMAHSTQIPLIKKDCVGAERYSHDFNASISYLEQETWIENPFDSNKEVKLNGCQISATTYPHLQQASNCARSFEDHNLLTRQAMKTYIDDSTQTPSEIFISECSNGFNDIPYAIGAVTLSNDGNTKTRNYTRSDGTNHQTTEPTESKSFVHSDDNFGIYTWTVPADVTSIYATVTSGQGGGGGGGTGSTALTSYPGSNGKNGGISSVGSLLLSNEGNGGNGGSKGDGYNDNVYDGGNGGFGLISIKSKYITVTLGQSITITVGNGGNGGNGSYWRGTAGGIGGTGNGSGGHREKANVNAQGGAGGAHGSVMIKY